MMSVDLAKRLANGGRVLGSQEDGLRLFLPELPSGKYGLAQVDNYANLSRRKFPYQAPLKLRLEARISDLDLPGTWGFGFWNDPFSFGFGGGGMARLLPVLPNVAWFFYGSQENHLSLRDDQPGCGFHAKTFKSPRFPSISSLLAIPLTPLLFWPATARVIRRLAKLVVKETSTALPVSVNDWHVYELTWFPDHMVFLIDQQTVFQTAISPQGRLGLVIWIDNQYFRFDPNGNFGFGFIEVSKEQWLQLRDLSVASL
jgi:hypothetical protein